jgi:prepilin-type N-terminal cleavage/methylation domain-containing protein
MRFRVDERGLTLTEVLVAAVILGIVAAAYFPAFDANRKMAVAATSKVQAFYLAQEKMEEVRATGYDAVQPVPDLADFSPAVDGYRYKVGVTENADTATKTVLVAVYYDLGREQREISLIMERSG